MKLHAYQEQAVDHLNNNPRAGLFLDMGLGKTATVLRTIKPEHLPVLVVAPKRVAEHVWEPEGLKWARHLNLIVAKGTPARRKIALASGADVIVIGRDNLKDVKPGVFTTIVLDELSGFKNRSTQRWRLARRLVKDATYVWGLTGTPAPNGLIDLWAQLFLLDVGARLGRTLGAYRDRYFRPGYTLPNGIVTEWVLKPGAEAAIHKAVADICLSMEAIDHLDLPPVTYNDVAIDLPRPANRIYEDMKRDLVADIGMLDGTVFTAANAAVLSGKLSQISAGFLYHDNGGWAEDLHHAKIDALQEIIDGTGSPVLVFHRFKAERSAILNEIDGAESVDAPGAIERWNAGEIPVLMAHPASAGHGLNLQSGGHTIVWTTLPWSLEEYLQANGRLARQGQTKPVVIHHLLSTGTIDGEILSALGSKKSIQSALLDHLKR